MSISKVICLKEYTHLVAWPSLLHPSLRFEERRERGKEKVREGRIEVYIYRV